MPLALNGDAGNQPGMVSTFFRRVANHFANEVAVVTPNGELLSHDLDEGLKKWKEMPADQRRKLDDLGPFDDSYLPSPPPEGLVLQVFSRGLMRDEKGRLQIYKTEVARSFEPGRDHFWLTESEANSLIPDEIRTGSSSPIAPHITHRICRRYLIDLVRVGGNGGPRRTEEVRSAAMQATIENSTADEVRLKINGSAQLATHDVGSGATKDAPKVDEFEMLGFAVYDRARKRFSRFEMIAYSATGHYDEIHKKVLPLGLLFELSPAKTPAERVPPSSYADNYFAKPNNR